jgi:hypothetical protein
MLRKALFGLVMLSLMLIGTGCGQEKKPKAPDMPVKGSNPIDEKTGKASKTIEASLEDPGAKKK